MCKVKLIRTRKNFVCVREVEMCGQDSPVNLTELWSGVSDELD